MIFSIPSSTYLANALTLPKGSCTFKQFSDGEWHVTIHDDVQDKQVWVLAQTGAPAANIIQLLLLCDALKRAGAHLNLLISYFGYARQDRPFKGEALAAEVMCKLLQLSSPNRIEVMHLHNPEIGKGIHNGTIFANHIPYEFFYDFVQVADVIVSPDKGARPLATHIAQYTNKEVCMLEKHRPEPEQVLLKIVGDVRNKRVLIVDDMITTGGTIMKAAELLYEKGATGVRVAATHGVFAGDALKRLEDSSIEHISVTNTLEQRQASRKVSVKDISSLLRTIVHM